MWDLPVFGIAFFKVFYFFFIYCFLGWIYESLYCSIVQRKWVNRGFLNGPVIPIYGCAATVIFLTFYNPMMVEVTKERNALNLIIIYVVGAVAASVLEFVTSYVMEKLFHAKWWDYSNIPLNLQGRICLPVSLFWGLMSLLLTEVLHPRVEKLVDAIPRPLGEYVAYVIFAVFLADFITTVKVTLQLSKRLDVLQKLHEEVYEYINGLKRYELKEELKGKLLGSKLGEALDMMKERLDTAKESFQEKRQENEGALEFRERKEALEAKLQDFMTRYREQKEDFAQRMVYRRIFKAFPNMKVKDDRKEAFSDLKEKLRSYKKR